MNIVAFTIVIVLVVGALAYLAVSVRQPPGRRNFATSFKFKSMSKRGKWILNATSLIAVVNFLAFVIVAVYVGGDALNGYVKGQHYFVCAHGSCREVTEAFWRYSYWHAVSGGVGILLVFAVAAILVNTGDIELDFNART